jgi:hypothetical protein
VDPSLYELLYNQREKRKNRAFHRTRMFNQTPLFSTPSPPIAVSHIRSNNSFIIPKFPLGVPWGSFYYIGQQMVETEPNTTKKGGLHYLFLSYGGKSCL